jgi:glycosyltransferase involved in cell wall biosynthesis
VRVLHVIETPDPGGAESVLVSIAAGIRPEHESLGLALCEGWTTAQLRERGIATTVMPLRRAFDLSWPLRFSRFLRQQRIDVVHGHEFSANCYGALGARLAGVPMVCTTHGKNYWPLRYYRRAAYRWVVRNTSAFVAVSEDLRQFAVATLGIDASRIAMIPNGIDSRKFRPDSAQRARTREVLGIAPDALLVLSVGELSLVKGHSVLVAAMRDVVRRHANAVGISANMRLLGYRRDIAELLNAADLLVMPSLSEGMPLAILEAMSAGVPVIATRVGGIPELITEGASGWLVAVGDAAQLAIAMTAALSSSDMRRRFAVEGIARVAQRCSDSAMIAAYVELYQRALER